MYFAHIVAILILLERVTELTELRGRHLPGIASVKMLNFDFFVDLPVSLGCRLPSYYFLSSLLLFPIEKPPEQ